MYILNLVNFFKLQIITKIIGLLSRVDYGIKGKLTKKPCSKTYMEIT